MSKYGYDMNGEEITIAISESTISKNLLTTR